MSALDTVLDALHARVGKVRTRGDGAQAQCPSHDDWEPSLSVRHADADDGGGRVLLHCHAGCDSADVLAALELTWSDLYDDAIPTGRQGIERDHPYLSGSGRLIGSVHRLRTGDSRKTFRPMTRNGTGWQHAGSDDLKVTPYRLPELVAAIDRGEPVYIVEGERDADTLAGLGVAATCNSGGAGKWTEHHAGWLRGAEVIVCRDRDGAGRDHADAVVASLAGIAASVRLVEPVVGKDVTEHVGEGRPLGALVEVPIPATEKAPEPAARATLVRLADVEPERVEWLWPGRLPAGKLTVLDGDPALGKSTVALDIAARLSAGRGWPDGTECPVADSVILSAEDGLADTVRPRVDAAGGDPDRVHALTAVAERDDGGQWRERPPTLRDLDAIEHAITSTGARLLVVDVLMAYLGGRTDSHRDQDIRAALAPVAALAERTGAAVLLLRHLKKGRDGGSPMYAGGGSIGIVGACRAGYVVAPDPDDDTGARRILAATKCNLAPLPESLSYSLASAPGRHVAHVVWGEASAHDAAHLLRAPAVDDEDHGERDEVTAWLGSLVEAGGGTVTAKSVFREAGSAGYSRDQVKRAKKRLGLMAEKAGMGGGWHWTDPARSDTKGAPKGAPKGAKGVAPESPPPSTPSALPSTDEESAAHASEGLAPGGDGADRDDGPAPTAHCAGCGAPLLVVRPGRDRCERCRLDARTADGAA